jgi:hypothetical protein
LFIIAGRAERGLPNPIQGSVSGLRIPNACASPSRAGGGFAKPHRRADSALAVGRAP